MASDDQLKQMFDLFTDVVTNRRKNKDKANALRFLSDKFDSFVNEISDANSVHLERIKHSFVVVATLTHRSLDEPNDDNLEKGLLHFWNKMFGFIKKLAREKNIQYQVNNWKWHNCLMELNKDKLFPSLIPKESNLMVSVVPQMLLTFFTIEYEFYEFSCIIWIVRLLTESILEMKALKKPVDSSEWQNLIDHLILITDKLDAYMTMCNEKDENVLNKTIVALFDDAISTQIDEKQRLMAKRTIAEVALIKKIPKRNLLWNSVDEITTYICQLVLAKLANGTFNSDFLNECLLIFNAKIENDEQIVNFFKKIIPPVIVESNSQMRNLFLVEVLKFLRKKDDQDSRRDLLLFFKTDFLNYFFFETKLPSKPSKIVGKIEDILKFLADSSNISFKHDIKLYPERYSNEILFRISLNYNNALLALSLIASCEKMSSDEILSNKKISLTIIECNEDIRKYLRVKILSFYHHLDEWMTSSLKIQDKLTAIKSFSQMIKIMQGECILAMRAKLMNTLINITSSKFYEFAEIIKAGCEAWKCLINALGEKLRNHMASIAASMLPLLGKYPKEAADILETLISKDGKFRYHRDMYGDENMKLIYGGLYFIPKMKELEHINTALSPYIIENPMLWKDAFNIPLYFLMKNENLLVKEVSLRRIVELLSYENYQPTIYQSCRAYDIGQIVDPFISQLVSTLLNALVSTNSTIRLLIAECFGQLGAIDPARINEDKPELTKEDEHYLYLNFNHISFKVDLVTILMRSINSSDNVATQNSASYALQEVLKYFKITDDEKIASEEGKAIWKEIRDDDVKQCCKVLIEARYKVPIKSPEEESQSQNMIPLLFGSEKALTFKDWIQNWCHILIENIISKEVSEDSLESPALSQSSQSSQSLSPDFPNFLKMIIETYEKEKIPCKILICNHLIVSRDENLAQFLLPFIIITALRKANELQRISIVDEIKAVTNKAINSTHQSRHLCAQAVFHLYDFLKVWSKRRKRYIAELAKTTRHLKPALKNDREFQGVHFLLSQTSLLEMANLAFDCKAYARALRYLEGYLKEVVERRISSSQETFQREIPLFLKIFTSLDEIDFVDGCNTKRVNEPSLEEMVLIHEVAGEIQEALNFCGKLIQTNPINFEYRSKYMSILLNDVDQVDNVYHYGRGLMNQNDNWKKETTPFVVEAAWKLGFWDQIDDSLKDYNIACQSNIGVGIGILLSTIKKNKFEDFEAKLNLIREQQIDPLTAAAMEVKGYMRGHQAIIGLHILNDIQVAIKYLYDLQNDDVDMEDDEVREIPSPKDRFLQVVKIWDERLSLVRKAFTSQEPILSLHRAMMSIIKHNFPNLEPLVNKEIFKTWIKSLRLSRKVGCVQRAYTCWPNVEISFNNLDTTLLDSNEIAMKFSEQAKVLWRHGQKENAIKTLKDVINRYFNDVKFYCFSKLKIEKKDSLIKALESNFSSSDQSISLNGSDSTSSSNSQIDVTPQSYIELIQSNKIAFARLQLLLSKYIDEESLYSTSNIASMYQCVTISYENWEKGYYYLGMYYNKILENEENKIKCDRNAPTFMKPESMIQIKGKIVSTLVKSICCDLRHVHTSLPRLLNVWFDLGTELHKLLQEQSQLNQKRRQSKGDDPYKALLLMKIKTIEGVLKRLTDEEIAKLIIEAPSYIMFNVFDQIQGRLLHPNEGIRLRLRHILIQLILDYPQQAMWMLMRSIHSRNKQRKNFLEEILKKAKNRLSYGKPESGKVEIKFIDDILMVAKELNDLCIRGVKGVQIVSLQKIAPNLHKLVNQQDNLSKILVPFQAFTNLTMPAAGCSAKEHNPFGDEKKFVYFRKIDDKVEVLSSLQRPKKITVKGTDGKQYIILCKANDDLRKDSSLLQFNNLLNQFFTRDAETRKRQLRIKTYFVVALSDNTGLIEWIPKLKAYKSIIEGQYRINGGYGDLQDPPKKLLYFEGKSLRHKIDIFKNEVLPKFVPPVFAQWYIENYSDPLSWFLARMAFARTSAVFSITGYLFGLGDRHGENILICDETGEAVHVDLNCLFNRGEDFKVPEKVPFRLTHNMINAMGPTGFDGPFRKACEHTLRVIRNNKESLLNFVTPIYYDHLMEWYSTNIELSQFQGMKEECISKQAEKYVSLIQSRIDGMTMKNEKGLPVGMKHSIVGQVDHIIKESIDIQNLSVMYIGWAPFL